MKWLVRGLVLGLLAAPAIPQRAQAAPAEFLPTKSPAYEEIEALAARGLLDSIAVFTRPLVRVDVARALLRAKRLHPGVENDLHYRRLERELARELTDLDAPPATPETGPLVDTGPREQRFRVSAGGHLRADYDEKRDAAHYMIRDESSVNARISLQLWPSFGAYEDLGITRIRGQRVFIDAVALHTDLESTVFRAELTGRTGPFTAALGYDTFRWGPGQRGTLLLADAAGPMGFLMYTASLGGRVTGTALSAQLSRADHRYMAAHRIEARVSPRVTLGLAEAVRYRSDNVDLIYASGLIPYAIVERIQIRDASTDSVRIFERANVMASLDASWRVTDAATVYGELLIDDLATENKDMPDRIAYQAGVRSDRPWGARAIHLGAEYTRVYNFTYAVEYGQNFIHRDRPLGFALGPDSKNVWVTGALDLSEDWQLRASGDFTNHGAGRLGDAWDTWMGPVSNVGLSGIVERTREVWADARFLPRDDVDVSVGVGHRTIRNEHNVEGRSVDAWLMRLAMDLRY